MKSIHTISIDPVVWNHFQRLFPNEASSYIETCMKRRIRAETDPESLNIDLLKVENTELKEKFDEIGAKLSENEQKIKAWEEKQRVKEKISIEKEKEDRIQAQTCFGCGSFTTKPEFFGEKIFCKDCVYNNNPKLLQAIKEQKQLCTEKDHKLVKNLVRAYTEEKGLTKEEVFGHLD